MPVYALLRAVILDFRGSIWESLQGYARLRPLACSDSGFHGVNLGITARLCPFTLSCVQRFLISGSNLGINAAEKSSACSGRSGNEVRVRFYSSLPQRRMVPPAVVVAATRSASDSILRCSKGEWFRLPQSSRLRRIACLQQSRGVQAGTGCHEGGIILSKKPPKWRLSLPYQRSASESNLLCGKVEWFRLQQSSRQRRIARPPQQRSASEANLRRVNEGSLRRSENESRRKTMRFSSYSIPEHSSVF